MPPKPDFQEAVEKFISGEESTEELPIRALSFAISAEQINEAHNAAILVVPPAGVGTIVLPLQMAGVMSPGDNPYTGGLTLYLGHGLDFVPTNERCLEASVLNATAEETFIAKDPSINVRRPRAEMENVGLYLKTDSPASSLAGPIVAWSIASGGTGWEVGFQFGLSTGSGDAVGVVDSVDGNGAVLTAHLTNNGTFYPVGEGFGAGVLEQVGPEGLTIDITEVDLPPEGDGSAAGAIGFLIVNLP